MYVTRNILKFNASTCLLREMQILQKLERLLHMGSQQRNIFNLSNKKRDYCGRKLVGYSMVQMYTVVADVKNYRNFVPFCKKSTILTKSPNHLKASLEIGFPPIVESYTSNVFLLKPNLVKAKCTDGRLFKYLETNWKFSPGLTSNPQSCIIDFSVIFEFRSVIHSRLACLFFDKVVKQMEGAFIIEASKRYGRESLPSYQLVVVRS